jgi:hypothetical protein
VWVGGLDQHDHERPRAIGQPNNALAVSLVAAIDTVAVTLQRAAAAGLRWPLNDADRWMPGTAVSKARGARRSPNGLTSITSCTDYQLFGGQYQIWRFCACYL